MNARCGHMQHVLDFIDAAIITIDDCGLKVIMGSVKQRCGIGTVELKLGNSGLVCGL